MNFVYQSLIICSIFFLFACGNNDTKQTKKTVKKEKPAKVKENPLPQLPVSDLKKLFEKCEGIEVTFYDAPVSMSTNSANTKNFIAFTRQESVYPSMLQKRALGIMSYNMDGDIYLEAEFYADLGNTFTPYFKFIKDKKNYYNVMSPEGANVFSNPLKGVPQR